MKGGGGGGVCGEGCVGGVEGCAGAMIIRGDLSKGIRDLTFRYPRYSQIFVNLFQMSIGFVSNLIVFPPIILIIYLFKKSKPLKKRINRLDVGLEQGKLSLLMTSQFFEYFNKKGQPKLRWISGLWYWRPSFVNRIMSTWTFSTYNLNPSKIESTKRFTDLGKLNLPMVVWF